ncbi:hypothetical protein FRC12_002458 [Ceratobasidium sp. 428]|nr:hypothetical protein FRC12_002458 [Ceratobasidium sp. 428]
MERAEAMSAIRDSSPGYYAATSLLIFTALFFDLPLICWPYGFLVLLGSAAALLRINMPSYVELREPGSDQHDSQTSGQYVESLPLRLYITSVMLDVLAAGFFVFALCCCNPNHMVAWVILGAFKCLYWLLKCVVFAVFGALPGILFLFLGVLRF